VSGFHNVGHSGTTACFDAAKWTITYETVLVPTWTDKRVYEAFAKKFIALHTLETMTQALIDGQKFVELLLMEFPELRRKIQEWQDLDHLQMMEFMHFTVRACERADWATVEKCLRFADELLRLGDSKIKNAVYVSYLESLPRKGEVHDRLRQMMTSELRTGWDEILAYLSKLLGN
jgi:hypothetical protein